MSGDTSADGQPAEVMSLPVAPTTGNDTPPSDKGPVGPAAEDHNPPRAGATDAALAEQRDQPAGAASADPARSALARAKADADARRRASAGRGTRPQTRPDPRHGGSSAVSDGPELFGSAIRRLVDERGWASTVQAGSVVGRWDALVGADLAAHCRPERFDDGELVLVAESTAWATQVRLLAPAVLARLATELGAGVVRSLRVHGPTAPDWQAGPRRVTGGRGPRDTYG